ncbi:MAG TPA: hypothetical protein PK322_10375 [Opitutaceae bacterium]|nr:hypothetical protein [Acidobacteriota bacterium]HQF39510.1 hypothetical protein [Opitutaceae bacterium]
MADTPDSAPASSVGEDNTAAIVGYLFGVGLVIGAVIHGGKKTRLGAFHLRQALGILLLAIAGTVAFVILGFLGAFLGGIPVAGWMLVKGVYLLAWFFRLGLLILTLLGLLAAVNREQKPLPVIGAVCQRLFASVFA